MLQRILPLLLASAMVFSLKADDVLFEYDFSNLNPGPLLGQAGWSDYGPGPDAESASPEVIELNGERRVVLGQTARGEGLISRGKREVSAGVFGEEQFALEFDVMRDDPQSIALVGLGSTSEVPARVGILFDKVVIREQKFDGRIHNLFGPDGSPYQPNPGDWYRIRSVWKYVSELGAWTGTVEIRNLTLGEEEFTPLYFNDAQTQDSAPLGVFEGPERVDLWDLLLVRTGTPGGKLGNIQVIRVED